MPSSLIRSRAMITHVLDRHRWNAVSDGAVLQEDGVIAAIGSYEELSRKHPDLPVIGSGNEILLPGLVNGHHHVGLTPVQLGSPDMPLELWFVTRMVARNLNLYLDTLYSAFEMIASGVTTVQHLHGGCPESSPRSTEAPTRRSAPMRMSGCGSPTPLRCGTRIGSYINETKISSPACRRNSAGQCSVGTTASSFR